MVELEALSHGIGMNLQGELASSWAFFLRVRARLIFDHQNETWTFERDKGKLRPEALRHPQKQGLLLFAESYEEEKC